MSWFDRFKVKRKCALCDGKLDKEPAEIELQCADGILKMRICDGCYKVLDERNRQAQELYNDDDPS
jgi:hypothetical protein